MLLPPPCGDGVFIDFGASVKRRDEPLVKEVIHLWSIARCERPVGSLFELYSLAATLSFDWRGRPLAVVQSHCNFLAPLMDKNP